MTDTTWVESVQELQECIQEERFEEAISLCKGLLEQQEELPASLVPLIQETYLKCELHQENFVPALKDSKSFPALHAYALYRLHQYEKAKNAAQNDDNRIAQHVLAQSLYRLNESNGALKVYQRLLAESRLDEEERFQVQINALAAATANVTPYVTDEEVVLDVNTDAAPCDLLYNLATYQLVTGSSSSRPLLQEAARMSDSDAATAVQLEEWSLQFQGLPGESVALQNLPEAVACVQAVNRATSLKNFPSSLPENWTPLQQRLYYYKLAVLQLRANKYAEFHETCQLLLNKKKKLPPLSSKVDDAWWKARVYVLQAHCLLQESKIEEAVQLLKERLDILNNMPSGKVVDHAKAFVMLHLYHFEGKTDSPVQMIELLQSLPESISSRKGTTATLVSLYQELGQADQASALLEESEGRADFLLSQGKYEEAAELLQDGPELVLALSYFDPVRAQEVWDSLDLEEAVGEEVDGEELEARDLPRFKSKKVITETSDKKTKRSHDAVLRRRARKREEYLKEKNIIDKKPDPERWLPKHERSYNKRRRNRKGAQGGVSEKDAAKLDVAARRGAESTGPSTAHMEVSSGTKRGARRR